MDAGLPGDPMVELTNVIFKGFLVTRAEKFGRVLPCGESDSENECEQS